MHPNHLKCPLRSIIAHWPRGCEAMSTSLTESVYKDVLQKSIPAQICQLILYYRSYEEYVEVFVRESTFAEWLVKIVRWAGRGDNRLRRSVRIASWFQRRMVAYIRRMVVYIYSRYTTGISKVWIDFLSAFPSRPIGRRPEIRRSQPPPPLPPHPPHPDLALAPETVQPRKVFSRQRFLTDGYIKWSGLIFLCVQICFL